MSTTTTYTFEMIGQLFRDWDAQRILVDEIQKELTATGLSIKQLEAAYAEAKRIGNDAQAGEYATEIQNQANWQTQLGNKIVAAKNLLAEKLAAYETAKSKLSEQEKAAVQAALDAQTQAIIKQNELKAQQAIREITATQAAAKEAARPTENYATGDTKYYIIGAIVLVVIVATYFFFTRKPKPLPAVKVS